MQDLLRGSELCSQLVIIMRSIEYLCTFEYLWSQPLPFPDRFARSVNYRKSLFGCGFRTSVLGVRPLGGLRWCSYKALHSAVSSRCSIFLGSMVYHGYHCTRARFISNLVTRAQLDPNPHLSYLRCQNDCNL